MKRTVTLGVLTLALFLVAGALIAAPAHSARSQQTSPAGQHGAPPPTLIFNRKLVSTTQSWSCCGTTTLGSGFVAIDSPLNFRCPTGGCTVSAQQNVQIETSTDSNAWAICTYVDGSEMTQPECPYLGYIPNDGFFHAGNFTQNQSGLAAGAHTLQTYVYSDNGATLGIYNITYQLYTP